MFTNTIFGKTKFILVYCHVYVFSSAIIGVLITFCFMKSIDTDKHLVVVFQIKGLSPAMRKKYGCVFFGRIKLVLFTAICIFYNDC